MYFTGPHGMEMPRQSLRLAGAQIPVGTNIQANKREILKYKNKKEGKFPEGK